MKAVQLSQINQETMAWAEIIEADQGVPISVHTNEHILAVSHCSENLPWLEAGDAVVVQLCGEYAMVLYKVVNIDSHHPAVLPIMQGNGLQYSHFDSELIFQDDGKLQVKTPGVQMKMDSKGNFLLQAENIELCAESHINFYCERLSIET